jgi:hypothetical protein
MKYLGIVSEEDIAFVEMREKTYQGSWKKRGGVGAFMMLARKWDRMESMIAGGSAQYDIFAHIAAAPDGADGTMLAEVRDLRRYLLLVEAEMMSQEIVERVARQKADGVRTIGPHFDHVRIDGKVHDYRPGTPEDGGHHESHHPYLADREWLAGNVTVEQWNMYWHRLGQSNTFVLDTVVPKTVEIPRCLVGKYRESGAFYVIKMGAVPSELRENYVCLKREMNAKEHDEQPPWAREMYRWIESSGKYVIGDDFVAWTGME